MPKQMLTGTLDEQCAFLYGLAREKMAAGNYTGAIHALKEILKYAPDYPGAGELMATARRAKREQSTLVWISFAGAVVAVFFGTWRGVPNDLWFLGLAVGGGLVGYLLGLVFVGRGKRAPRMAGESAAHWRAEDK
jgi:hypothetical protein